MSRPRDTLPGAARLPARPSSEPSRAGAMAPSARPDTLPGVAVSVPEVAQRAASAHAMSAARGDALPGVASVLDVLPAIPVASFSTPQVRVSVLVPFRDGGAERARNWAVVRALYERRHPRWEVVVAPGPDGTFSRAGAICDAAERATGDVFVVADADVWSDGFEAAVAAVAAGASWADPADEVLRMSPEATETAVWGGDFDAGGGQSFPKQPPCGGAVVVSREVLRRVPPDRRFVGWGGEESAWSVALAVAFGAPHRVRGRLWHLWHPPAADSGRIPAGNVELLGKYRAARDVADVEALVAPVRPNIEIYTNAAVFVKRAGSRPRFALVSDVRGWAFDQNMHDLAEYLSDYDCTHVYVHDSQFPDWRSFDGIYELFHRNPWMGIPKDRALGALRSEWFKPEKPGPPDEADVRLVNSYRAFQVATRRNCEELKSRCPGVVYLTNPINVRRFRPTALRSDIVVSWNGNANHTASNRKIKHFYDIVIPACVRAGVALVAAEYSTKSGFFRRRVPSEMSDFYQQANVALCASEYEAASFSVMEAMASGLAVIATDVGNHHEMVDSQMQHFGDSGICLVGRSVESFAAAINALTPQRAREMGEINRREIVARWSWDAWQDRYRQFFGRVLS